MSGRHAGDAAVFIINSNLESMRTLRLDRTGAFLGIAAHAGIIYATGQAGDGVLLAFPFPAAAAPTVEGTLYALPTAELLSVAAHEGGAVAVGRMNGAGVHLQLGGEAEVAVSGANNIKRFRQVDFVDGVERYTGDVSGTDYAFVGARLDNSIAMFPIPTTEMSGVSGRMANLNDGGFIATEGPDDRVQLTRFGALNALSRSVCARMDTGALTPTSSIEGVATSHTLATTSSESLVLFSEVEPFRRESVCASQP